MSQEELDQENVAQKPEMSMLDRIRSWGKNPRIAEARHPKTTSVVNSSLRCREDGGPLFDVGVTLTADKKTVRFRNDTHEVSLRGEVSSEFLLHQVQNGVTDSVSFPVSNRMLSVKRKVLENTLKHLGLLPQ